MNRQLRVSAVAACTALLIAGVAFAVTTPQYGPELAAKEFRHANLHIQDRYVRGDETEAIGALSQLGVAPNHAHLDQRTGRWASLTPTTPLIPGNGVGNDLRWSALRGAPTDNAALKAEAWSALSSWMSDNQLALGIDVAEVRPVITVHRGGDLIQVTGQRYINGIRVRKSQFSAAIGHGNLIAFGASNWGDMSVSSTPTLSAESAEIAARGHLEGMAADGRWGKNELTFIPMADGDGLTYRLAWATRPNVRGMGNWEALVDAHSGEMLSFTDTNHYLGLPQTFIAEGGVLPVTNDDVAPGGVEDPDSPMPFVDMDDGTSTTFADAGGNLLGCTSSGVTSTLDGQMMRMNDACGAISLSSSSGVLDFGTNAGTDCSTPGFGGPGNTRSSRSGYYEMTRIKQMAISHLPDNTWLQGVLQANMNINANCNANWNGSQVNFFTSGGGCSNTGELAGVFDHEWGHGQDANDASPGVSNPGEGIADIYAAMRLHGSCIGHNFRPGIPCGGYGDGCVPPAGGGPACSGVRDIDWANRASGAPHDVTWIAANCGGGPAPCGGSVHCEGAVYSESWWDLYKRDLPTLFGMSDDTAAELTTYLALIGGGAVGPNWFSCTQGEGGCATSNGYKQFLIADDDDGSLANGTPHMTAIFSAFDRHGIACSDLTVQNSGCFGTPITAPVVTATVADRGVRLTWPPVLTGPESGALGYEVYRADGPFGCDFGKEKVGDLDASTTEFVDTGLKNGREYSYTVIAKGPGASCFGPASTCTSVTPLGGGNLAVAADTFSFNSGDGDAFIDNCEQVSADFTVTNIGTGAQTGIEVLSASSPSHPGTVFTDTFPVPVGGVGECASTIATLNFIPEGLATDDTLVIELSVQSAEMSIPSFGSASFPTTETDLSAFGTQSFTFEAGTDGWTLISGTFNRTGGGGADGTTFFEASSSALPDQCDQLRSPGLVLSSDSTLSMWSNYEIEDDAGGTGPWYDRANVGTYDPQTGVRTHRIPDGGRPYDVPDGSPNGTCDTADQAGWADANQSWAESTFSATALDSASLAGNLVHLQVNYGTDPGLHLTGFWFDEVDVTNAAVQVADAQSNLCSDIFADGFESGDVDAWTAAVP